MMVLVTFANTRYIRDNWNLKFLEQLGIAYSRSLEDLRSTEGTSGHDYELGGFDDVLDGLAEVGGWLGVGVGLVFNADCAGGSGVVEDDADDFGFEEDVEVGVLAVLEERVDVAMSCILSLAIWRNISLPSLSKPISPKLNMNNSE
jgi:hypothetical protein